MTSLLRFGLVRVLACWGALSVAVCGAVCCSVAMTPAAAGHAGHGSGSTPAWVSFQDPFEQAFTAEVPKGWTVRGGLFRMGYSDERPMVDLTSPDGRINVRLGDVSIPVYAVPDRLHGEGTIIDLGAQAQLVVAHYRLGPEFAALYSKVRFHSICKATTADTDDLGTEVPNSLPSDGPPAPMSAGQIASHCSTEQGARVAYAFVRTSELSSGLWLAP